MKTPSLIVLALAAVLGSTAAEARPRPHGFSGAGDFQANKRFGLGLELGDIVGLTGKLFVTPNQAIDFGLGDLYTTYYGDYGRYGGGLHVYADYLWHPVDLVKAEAFELPLYIGVGGRFWNFDYGCNPGGGGCFSASALGVRVPVGITFDFNNVPLDIFIQIVPTFDFFHNFGPHDVYLDFDASIGIRYWFS